MSGDEMVTICDEHGAVVGSATRARMRAEGLWHATTSVLVRSGDGRRVYVHRRTADKDVYPGRHDCFAGGVVAAGEPVERSAYRELSEELGITGVPLRALFRFRFDDGATRHHCSVFETRWGGPIVWQPEEVAWGRWMDLEELRGRLADPAWPFVPDGRQGIEEWFRRHDPAHG